MKSLFRRWIPVAFVAIVLSGLSYAGTQQVLRQDANDPQVQLAEDVTAAMNAGATSTDIVPQTSVDMEKSLAPFVLIYDKDNKISGTDAVIGTEKPNVPNSVLDAARSNGSNRVTWEPKAGVRSAIVAMKDKNNNVVVVGRSIREVELRAQQQMIMAVGALGVALVGSFLLMMMLDGGMKPQNKSTVVMTTEHPIPAKHEVPATEHPDHHDQEKKSEPQAHA